MTFPNYLEKLEEKLGPKKGTKSYTIILLSIFKPLHGETQASPSMCLAEVSMSKKQNPINSRGTGPQLDLTFDLSTECSHAHRERPGSD